MNDRALARAARAGDRSSFSALIERHAPRMYPIALVITSRRADAEDAVQSAALVAFRKLHQLRDDAAFVPWFRRTVINEARNVVRRRRPREVPIGDEAENVAAGSPDIEQRIDVHGAINRLPDRHRRVVLLCYGAGLTTGEAAHALDIPAGTVRRLVSESRPLLRLLLEDYGSQEPASGGQPEPETGTIAGRTDG